MPAGRGLSQSRQREFDEIDIFRVPGHAHATVLSAQLVSLDTRHHLLVTVFSDGSVIIVIAHEDPGPRYPNWLNTLGHDQGGMNGRIVGATQFPKEMKTKIVKLRELRG